MIPDLSKIVESFRAGVGAARAVMDGRSLVERAADDLAWVEACACPTSRVLLIHNRGTYCGDQQSELVQGAMPGVAFRDDVAEEILDQLAEEADRRDGVRRGPR